MKKYCFILILALFTPTVTALQPALHVYGGEEKTLYYKFLIIVPDNKEWIDALKPFLEWKIREGGYYSADLPSNCLPVKVVNLTEIEAKYGSANASSIRSYIIEFWKQNRYTLGVSTLKYVLLVGDARIIPTYLYNVTIDGQTYTYAADQYYADFYNPSTDQYINPAVDHTDWKAEVYVGRFPVNNVEELSILVNKTVTYEKHLKSIYEDSPAGWERSVLFLGAVMDNGYYSDGYQVWKDGAFVAEVIKRQCENWWYGTWPPLLRAVTLYDSNNNETIWPPQYANLNNIHNLTVQAVVNEINIKGFSGVFVVSHGLLINVQGRKPSQKDAKAWQSPFFSISDIQALNNSYVLPYWFIDACSTGAFESDLWNLNSKSLGEELLLADPSTSGGAIAFIGCSNVSWYRFHKYPPQNNFECLKSLSDALANFTFYHLYGESAPINYSPEKWNLCSALFKAKETYNSTSWNSDHANEVHMATLMGFNFLGDPTLQIWSETPWNATELYSIEVPSKVKPNENFTIRITVNFSPLGGSYPPLGPRKGAKVCVSSIKNGKITYFDMKLTDENGTVTFKAPSHFCTLNVTIIDHPYIVPWFGKVEVEDVNAPIIGSPLRFPSDETVQEGQDVKVVVNVTDNESGVKNVTLYYAVDDVWESVEMLLNVSSGFYEGIIPGQKAGKTVRFKIEAFDNAGNLAEQDNEGKYYTYQVVSELSWQLTISILTLLTIFTILAKKRKKF